MKQKDLWMIIALLLGCLALAGWTTWTVWTDAYKIFPVQEKEISYVYVTKENGCPTNGYAILSEAETKRLVDMLNQCQWEKTRDDMEYEELVIVDDVDPYDINAKIAERSYEVNIYYENKFRKRSFVTLFVFADEQVFVKYSNVQFYRETSGNFNELLELLDEQHLYCHDEHDAACQQKYGVLTEEERKQHTMWISAEEMAR